MICLEKWQNDCFVGRFENPKFLKIFLEHVDLAVIHKKWPWNILGPKLNASPLSTFNDKGESSFSLFLYS